MFISPRKFFVFATIYQYAEKAALSTNEDISDIISNQKSQVYRDKILKKKINKNYEPI